MDRIGPYRIQRRLGGGGFGEVWLGVQEPIGREVAVKVFRPGQNVREGFAPSPSMDEASREEDGPQILRARFLNEARILARLDDATHIVSVLDYGETDEGDPWYSMPYLPESLASRLGRDRFDARQQAELAPSERPRRLTLTQAMALFSQVLHAMAGAHEAGLVHRGLRPSCVLLTSAGDVRVADFGIASMPEPDPSAPGHALGSPRYMAPEQRVSAQHVDARADVFALGVLAYRMVTGTLPEGRFPDPDVLAPDLPSGVNSMILTALSQNPEDRYADAGAMRIAFDRGRATAPARDETGTGTAAGGAAPALRPELRPLHAAVLEELRAWGELDAETRAQLQPMADFAELSADAFDELIDTITERAEGEIRPIQRFRAAIDGWLDAGAREGPARDNLDRIAASIGLAEARVVTLIERCRDARRHGGLPPDGDGDGDGDGGGIGAAPSVDEDSRASGGRAAPGAAPTPFATVWHAIQQELMLWGRVRQDAAGRLRRLATEFGLGELDLEALAAQVAREVEPGLRPLTRFNEAIDRWVAAGAVPSALVALKQEGRMLGIADARIEALITDRLDDEVALPGIRYRDRLASGGTGPELVVVPAGAFDMGGPEAEGGPAHERPVHRVTIERPFAIGVFPVTFDEYDRFASATDRERPDDEGWGRGSRPVINVDWLDAVDYAHWLSAETGRDYRLPSEAEWEYAARAGESAAYWTGGTIRPEQACFGGVVASEEPDLDSSTMPVGSYPPNAFGLHDSLGNVWEFVQDDWHDRFVGAPANGHAWIEPRREDEEAPASFVVRGGAHWCSADQIRAASRSSRSSGGRDHVTGFRIAQAL